MEEQMTKRKRRAGRTGSPAGAGALPTADCPSAVGGTRGSRSADGSRKTKIKTK